MIKEIKNIIPADKFRHMRNTVMSMNRDIEGPIYEEMLHHNTNYNPSTGLRTTRFTPRSSDLQYNCLTVIGRNGHIIGMESLAKPQWLSARDTERAVFYIHGAGFQRRLQDLNLRFSERICDATGSAVYAPDYRIGLDYTLEETLEDILDTYRHLVTVCGYRPEHITVLADSSGCCSFLAAVQHLEANGLRCPGNIVLLSPFADASLSSRSVRNNRQRDFAFITNRLLENSIRVFTRDYTLDIKRPEISTIYGDYSCLKDTHVLIQVGTNERLLDDSVHLYQNLNKVCSCTLELYEDMFHNFETYHSYCEMAKVSQEHYVRFIFL